MLLYKYKQVHCGAKLENFSLFEAIFSYIGTYPDLINLWK